MRHSATDAAAAQNADRVQAGGDKVAPNLGRLAEHGREVGREGLCKEKRAGKLQV
jgi:hypothetical protein